MFATTTNPAHRFWLLDALVANPDAIAVFWRGAPTTRCELLTRVADWETTFASSGVAAGDAVAVVVGEACPGAIAALLALADLGCIVVPLTASALARNPDFLSLACVRWAVRFDDDGHGTLAPAGTAGDHPLMRSLRATGEPGMVIFTSGSSGKNKAALHSLDRLVDRTRKGRPHVTLAFLRWDHIGGQNTLLRLLAAGGPLVLPDGMSPDTVCSAIERHHVSLLPTSPTFLNLLLLSGAHERFDLSSLALITYGTEPMPASTLQRLCVALPHVRLKQTYGLSELGILPTQSEAADSLWVRPGADVAYRIQDGVLWLKVPSAMLGYLNAPNPFDADGWYDTGDLVEVRDGYLRFLGRRSEVINVGGDKVHPAEVESVLLEMDGVLDATVRGVASPVTGQLVEATVYGPNLPPEKVLLRAVRAHCLARLAPYAVPARVRLATTPSRHFKKMRAPEREP